MKLGYFLPLAPLSPTPSGVTCGGGEDMAPEDCCSSAMDGIGAIEARTTGGKMEFLWPRSPSKVECHGHKAAMSSLLSVLVPVGQFFNSYR